MRFCEIAFSSVVRTCSWLISSENVCGRYLRAMTWYMRREVVKYARPRVIRGTRVKPLPLLPSGPGGVCSRPLHEARSLTTSYATSFGYSFGRVAHFERRATSKLRQARTWLTL